MIVSDIRAIKAALSSFILNSFFISECLPVVLLFDKSRSLTISQKCEAEKKQKTDDEANHET